MTRQLSKEKIKQLTDSYQDYLIEDLRDQGKAMPYLQAALEAYQECSNASALLLAHASCGRSTRWYWEVSKKTHLNRESLYKTLSGKGNPKLNILGVLLNALGFQISI